MSAHHHYVLMDGQELRLAFMDLLYYISTTRGEVVGSPEFSCFGHQWKLSLYPGGVVESRDGYAASGLSNISNKAIKIQCGYNVRNADGKEVVYHVSLVHQIQMAIMHGATLILLSGEDS